MDFRLPYLHPAHSELPHLVNFSGGRSSGMMLLQSLDWLDPCRGDAVVFSNTTAEHAATYDFVRECKRRTEARGIPFFVLEYCTYEKLKRVWTRQPSYRLCTDAPWSEDNPDGFRHKGEMFEAMISMSSTVPNIFQRNCTIALKIDTTERFMKDWLAGRSSVPPVGHTSPPRMRLDEATYQEFVRHGGKQSRADYFRKRAHLNTLPPGRPELTFGAFTSAPVVASRPQVSRYVALVGFRADEPQRVLRMQMRRRGTDLPCGSERVARSIARFEYAPLAEAGVHKPHVLAFWEGQDFDLDLPTSGECSNCVFCFMKNPTQLARALTRMEPDAEGPMHIRWWADMEKKYRRVMPRSRTPDAPVIYRSFFRRTVEEDCLTYEDIAERGVAALGQGTLLDLEPLPCECTD